MHDEPEYIIFFAIKRSIEQYPGKAAAEMLKLILANASLEAEVFILKEKIREWAGPGGYPVEEAALVNQEAWDALADEDRALWKAQIMGSWEPPPPEPPKVKLPRERLMRTIRKI